MTLTHKTVLVGGLYSILIALLFLADVTLFCAQNTLWQFSLCLLIASALHRMPFVCILTQIGALGLLSLLFFGSVETYLLLALLVIACARFFTIVLHQRIFSLLATTATTFAAYYGLLITTYYPPSAWYTVQQFCANLVVVLVLFFIFEKIRHTG